jgi:hypothetical protein
MAVFYFDECSWVDVGYETIYQFLDPEGQTLAEVALKDSDAQLWKFEVMLPERYQIDQANPRGIVATQTAARKICELILLSTIVTR